MQGKRDITSDTKCYDEKYEKYNWEKYEKLVGKIRESLTREKNFFGT